MSVRLASTLVGTCRNADNKCHLWVLSTKDCGNITNPSLSTDSVMSPRHHSNLLSSPTPVVFRSSFSFAFHTFSHLVTSHICQTWKISLFLISLSSFSLFLLRWIVTFYLLFSLTYHLGEIRVSVVCARVVSFCCECERVREKIVILSLSLSPVNRFKCVCVVCVYASMLDQEWKCLCKREREREEIRLKVSHSKNAERWQMMSSIQWMTWERFARKKD